MRHKFILLTSALLLTACANDPQKAPTCSGNTLRGCQPVVYFDEGSYDLTWGNTETLVWALQKMQRFPRESIKVVGYTDSVGSPEKNLVLAKNRALAVKKYFTSKDIDPDRVVIDFKGESDPVCVKDNCRALNRRAELTLFKPNGGVDPHMGEKMSAQIDKVKCVLCEEE